jgi:hypothetical protein
MILARIPKYEGRWARMKIAIAKTTIPMVSTTKLG